MRPLLLCADDFGMDDEVDDGILTLAQRGRLSAFSCMTLSPRWPAAARRLNPSLRKRVQIGLHLDFTAYGAHPEPLPRLIARALLHRLARRELRSAIGQQLDLFQQATGRAPDYVDGHQHVHQLPQIRDALLAELAARGAPMPWLRVSRTPWRQGAKAAVIDALGAARLAARCRRAGIPHTDRLLGVYNFSPDYAERLARWFGHAAGRPATEAVALMCHPAQPGGTPAPDDPIRAARYEEFAVLNGPLLPQLLARHELTLATR